MINHPVEPVGQPGNGPLVPSSLPPRTPPTTGPTAAAVPTQTVPIEAVAVVVPAHDEADTIVRCLRSVLRAVDAGAPDADSVVVVACDRCRDGTAERARRALGSRGVVVEGAWSTVGEVRAAATAVALAHLARPPRRVWLANTDADTTVADGWLAEQLRLARAGWAVVTGTVHLHDASPGLARRFAAGYTTYADGTHPHVHGANLGVRADAYLAAGGWPRLGLAEDHALVEELRRQGEPVASSTAVRVHTSARLAGRAANGFAATLRRLQADKPIGVAISPPA